MEKTRIAVRAHGRFARTANASIVSLLSEILVRRDTNEGKRNKWPHRRQKPKSALPKSYLAPVALVFKDRLDAFSLFKISLLKLSDPRMARDSLAEGAESADALGVHLSILGITAFRREGNARTWRAKTRRERRTVARSTASRALSRASFEKGRFRKSFSSFRSVGLDDVVGPPNTHKTTTKNSDAFVLNTLRSAVFFSCFFLRGGILDAFFFFLKILCISSL